jgi:hypothetical protein
MDSGFAGIDRTRVTRPGSREALALSTSTSTALPISSAPSAYNPPQVQAPPPIDIQAQTNPGLDQTNTQYQDYLTRLKEGSGFAFDVAGQKARDAREGGRKALIQANALAGRSSTAGLSGYEAGTQRAVQGALTDAALGREQQYGSALSGAVTAAQAPVNAALAEKNLGLNAWQAQANQIQATNAANAAAQQTAWQQMMALLQAQRSSPLNDTSF